MKVRANYTPGGCLEMAGKLGKLGWVGHSELYNYITFYWDGRLFSRFLSCKIE